MLYKIYYGIWLCSWKCSRKYIFIRFLTFSQDPNKYYYRKSPYINTKRNKNQNHMRERERERERERSVHGWLGSGGGSGDMDTVGQSKGYGSI